ncbi:MAG: PorV/PorQ family protein [Bacteroidetes bacterium]|nr:PorV/PorQ family protein [Bacteroidota bacterium]
MKNLLAFITFLCISVSLFSQGAPCQKDPVTGTWIDTNGNQCFNPIFTAVPFLGIENSGQAKGMADIGVVANKYNYHNTLSQNPSLMARDFRMMAFHFNYMGWFDGIFNGNASFDIGGMYSLNDRHSVGTNLKYLGHERLIATDPNGDFIRINNPYELVFSASYALKFANHFSVGTSLKYIRSFKRDTFAFHRMNSIATDLGVNYFNSFQLNSKLDLDWNIGLAATNLGPKISYSYSIGKGYLPSNLSVGTAFSFDYDATQHLNFLLSAAYQADKLLVPTPSVTDADNNLILDFREYSSIKGMLVSFSDAPGGGKEELWEITHHFGLELRSSYKEKFAFVVRGGYFYEHPVKGIHRFYTIGTTISVSGLYLDISTLLNADPSLYFFNENTFSLGIGYQKKLSQ